MPNRWPISSGNWSNAAIWSGSLIPTASDDVFMNNQTVTLDQNITISSLRNAATGSAIAGGTLNIYNDYTINSTLIRSTSTSTYLITNYSTGSITINSQLNSGSVNGEGLCINHTTSGTLNIVGTVYTPYNANILNMRTILNSSTGTVNIIGNILAPIGTTAGAVAAVYNTVTGTINIIGNVYSPGTNITTYAIYTGTGIVNITGNVYGHVISTVGYALLNINYGTVNITGNVYGGLVTPTVYSTSGIINIIGTCQASTTANAVATTGTNTVLSGPLICSGSENAIYCDRVRMYDNVTTSYTIGVSGSSSTTTLYSPNQIKVPTQNNVRTGIAYGVVGEFTGTMNVPDPNTVSFGVPVDNTTGTAVVTPTDLWNYAATALTASNSI